MTDEPSQAQLTAASYGDAITELLRSGISNGELVHATAIRAALAAAGAVAAELDEDGIALFVANSDDQIEYLRESLRLYRAATDLARLN